MTEKEEVSIGVGKVPIRTQQRIDLLYNELEKLCIREGVEVPAKKVLYPAAIIDYVTMKIRAIVGLTKDKTWKDVKDKTARLIKVEEILEEIRKTLEAEDFGS